MIENIPDFLATLASIIGSISIIGGIIGVCVAKSMRQVNSTLSELREEIRQQDIRDCRIQLNSFMNLVKNGQDFDEHEWKLYHSMYDHYTNDLQQNSFIHDKWERIVKKMEK